jgi:exopolysaccharide biosynthesis polyprenyl glycosylphosphotransferase
MQPIPRPRLNSWRIRPREQRTILIVGDLLVAVMALIGGLYFWGQRDAWLKFSLNFLQQRVEPWFFLLPLLWILFLVELYDLNVAKNLRKTIIGIGFAALAGIFLYALIYLLSKPNSLPRLGIGAFLLLAALLTFFWRLIYIQVFTNPALLRRVLIIGAGKAADTIIQAFQDLHPQPFILVGLLDDDIKKIGQKLDGYPILAGNDRLQEIIVSEQISEIVISISGKLMGSTFQSILDAQESGVEVVPMPSMYEELLGRVPIHHLESDWLIRSFVDEARAGGFYSVGKRFLDILGGLVGLFINLIIFPFVAILILLESGWPVFYKQVRSGKGGRLFTIYKFRTMHKDAEQNGKVQLTQENDTRITRFGTFLRRTHIDELPQFLNVLRGDMSLVGPRSERPEWIAEFQKQIPFYRARLLVKPGITGWAQVNYSYYATVEEMASKLEYDLYYIKHCNTMMDILILLRTFTQVIAFRGR